MRDVGIIPVVIELKNVGVTYPTGNVVALTDISLHLPAGDFAFLVGPTGAGKSTLLKLLYADVRATSGSIAVAGRDITKIATKDIPALRRQMGIVLQDYGLLPQRTVRENVLFACEVLGIVGKEARSRVEERLAQVGMLHRSDAFPAQLSGGEQQRVAIARALVGKPALLIADEPTGNLDPETSVGIMDALLTISSEGTTVLVATHDKSAVDRLNRRVIAVERGTLARDDAQGQYGYAQ